GLLGCSSARAPDNANPDAGSGSDAGSHPDAGSRTTFRETSDAALATLQNVFYEDGTWKLCVPTKCSFLAFDDFDWGADSLTAALYLRWSLEKDAAIPPMMKALDANGPTYGACTATSCPTWSDVTLWDSIAAS